jgi:hypothetical protein
VRSCVRGWRGQGTVWVAVALTLHACWNEKGQRRGGGGVAGLSTAGTKRNTFAILLVVASGCVLWTSQDMLLFQCAVGASETGPSWAAAVRWHSCGDPHTCN